MLLHQFGSIANKGHPHPTAFPVWSAPLILLPLETLLPPSPPPGAPNPCTTCAMRRSDPTLVVPHRSARRRMSCGLSCLVLAGFHASVRWAFCFSSADLFQPYPCIEAPQSREGVMSGDDPFSYFLILIFYYSLLPPPSLPPTVVFFSCSLILFLIFSVLYLFCPLL